MYQNGNGHGSWFYRSNGTPAIPAVYKTVEHEAVTHEEVKFVRTVTTQGHYEYRWEILERTNTAADSGVEEPTEPDAENPAGPDADSSDTEPSEPNRPAVSNAGLKPNRPSARSRAVPLAIDAGL